MKKTNEMNCPNCGTQISIDELLVSQFQESIKNDLQSELQSRVEELNEEREEFKKLSLEFEKEKQGMEESIKEKVRAQISSREEALKDAIRREINEEKSLQLLELENELIHKSTQLKEMNATKAQLERLKRDMEEAETRIILEKERELSERLEQARSSITEQIQNENFLKLKEREKVIEDLKNKLDDAKRQAEQGSMQLQGQVQEINLAELLKEVHKFDEIIRSKTGVNGADILQIVKINGIECGKIYYESKRTKSWSNDWVKKFKQDNINTKADILVLVTSTLPQGIQRYGIIDGVWVCGMNDVKELSLVLRYGLMKIQAVAVKQHGKESKMELLYAYLTSEDFKNTFESILGGFKTLQDLHNSEKLKIQRMHKEREKVLEQVLFNTVEFYSSVKGIAGSAIHEVSMLDVRQAG